MTGSARRFLAGIIVVLASVAIFVTVWVHYADHVLAAPGSFANRAVTLMRNPVVESGVVSVVTDRLAAGAPDQSIVRPVIERAVREALLNAQVSADIRDTASSLQRQLVSGTATELTLRLPGIAQSIASIVETESPALADGVRSLGTITVFTVSVPPADAAVLHDLAGAGRDLSLLVILSVALVVLALLVSPDSARTLRGLGIGVAAGGLLTVGIYIVGRGIVVNDFSAGVPRTAASAGWSAYLGGLEIWGLVSAGTGALLALATSVSSARRSTARR